MSSAVSVHFNGHHRMAVAKDRVAAASTILRESFRIDPSKADVDLMEGMAQRPSAPACQFILDIIASGAPVASAGAYEGLKTAGTEDFVHILELADLLDAAGIRTAALKLMEHRFKSPRDVTTIIHALSRPHLTQELLTHYIPSDPWRIRISPYALADILEATPVAFLLEWWKEAEAETETNTETNHFNSLTVIFDLARRDELDEDVQELLKEYLALERFQSPRAPGERTGFLKMSTCTGTERVTVVDLDNPCACLPETAHVAEMYWGLMHLRGPRPLDFLASWEEGHLDGANQDEVVLILDMNGELMYSQPGVGNRALHYAYRCLGNAVWIGE
ncbi:hypothetical protein HYH03_011085 [Edaphochlamys debaryana]|uniref:Uncharacterized protein n=1 Tax=Edaphochlamys debaryana TaxID=47281 RepID=A0A836BWT4_9CHLO|nr:hypothetical protein HYH03_011085 [Edaphochlamys debaryana]|eukprot:KAG2490449.1 hypothetical protein HYH03_011085 [Edaphochlamys debaryana]